ncbi:MAG: guanine deaminase [Ignavibacteria bacterium]|nr:guanine deaminase [Ignavibacteria bacterium]
MDPWRLHAPLLSPVSPTELRWHPSGAVAVGADGRMLYAGDAAALPEQLLALPARETSDVVLPGFVDLHTHLPQYDARGKFGMTLLEWLEHFIFPEEARFADDAVARDVSTRFFRGMLEAGTTTAMVFSSVHRSATHIAFEEAERSKLRVILGKVQMDRDVPAALLETADASIRDTEILIDAWHRKTERLWVAVTPRFAPTCSMDLMRRSAALAHRHGTYVQTHLNESEAEIRMVRALFPDAGSYTAVYRDAGLLGERTVLAHNIHASDEELDLCAQHRCAVAHCPDSNLFLGSGRFPLQRTLDRGIRAGLGSDVGAGTTLSMFGVMRSMCWVQARSLHPFLPLYFATRGGAEALSMDGDIGSLEQGKQADMVAVRVDRHFHRGRDLAHLKPLEIASALVYRSQPGDVREVWVGGESLYRAET